MPELGETILPQYDRKQKRWVTTRRRGRVYDIEGRIIELFPLKVLAAAIKRTPQSVKLWEREKRFPKPMFNVPAQKGQSTRWYSKVQIANIRAVYQRNTSQKALDDFHKDVWQVFYKFELIDEAKGGDVV